MKRVLFVDDERSVLSVLERGLRPHRDRWTMTFAHGAVEALATLELLEIDAIVTDMRMRGMDGAALLEIVRDQHPDTVRIVLTGEIETARASRISALAHRLLSKPSDPEVIMGALDSACPEDAGRYD